MFNQFNYMPAPITYPHDKRLQRSQSNEGFSLSTSSKSNSKLALVSREKKLANYKNLIFSRYASDFIELEKLGQGGFGEVYKVRLYSFN
jgi:hypothetical protein